MAKAYRMTPKRRAALRKAQIASARARQLRRRKRRIKVAIVATTGTLAVASAGALVGRKIMGGPRSVVHHNPMAAKQLGPGRNRTRGNPQRSTHAVWNKNKQQWDRKKGGGVFKGPVQDTLFHKGPSYATRNRPAYDSRRRSEYAKRKKK